MFASAHGYLKISTYIYMRQSETKIKSRRLFCFGVGPSLQGPLPDCATDPKCNPNLVGTFKGLNFSNSRILE